MTPKAKAEDAAPSAEVVDLAASALGKLAQEKWRSSGLNDEDAEKLALRALPGSEVALLADNFLPTAALVIPYWNEKGEKTDFYRIRYLEKHKGFPGQAEKPQRYVQPTGTVNEVYFPPLLPEGVTWESVLSNPSETLYITEGEQKASCATKRGFNTIALGGVDMWHSKKRELSFFPQLEGINWKERKVFIIFDSDAATNPDVSRAQRKLAKAILDRGGRPRIVSLPPASGSKKQGLDDFLVAHDDGAIRLRRLIEQTPSLEETDALLEMNEEVVYVENDGGFIVRRNNGKVMRVADFTGHQFPRHHMDHSGKKPKKVKTAKEWLDWPARTQVKAVSYAPGQPEFLADGRYNTFREHSLVPVKGDVRRWRELLDVLFEGADDERTYFEQWCAYPLQHPGVKLHVAVLLWGKVHGSGKSTVGLVLRRLYGPENSIEIRNAQLGASFNASWAYAKRLIVGEEITSALAGAGKRADGDKLKAMITSPTVLVNQKFMPEFEVDSCANLIFTSNHSDALYIEDEDRRFFIHEVKTRSVKPRKYWDDFYDWLDNGGGAAAMLHYMLHEVDTSTFNPKGHAPDTAAKRSMTYAAKSDLGKFVADLAHDPESYLRAAGYPESVVEGCDILNLKQLRKLYDPEGTNPRPPSDSALGTELREKFLYLKDGDPIKTNVGSQRLYAFRKHEKWENAKRTEIAAHWNEHFQPTKVKKSKH